MKSYHIKVEEIAELAEGQPSTTTQIILRSAPIFTGRMWASFPSGQGLLSLLEENRLQLRQPGCQNSLQHLYREVPSTDVWSRLATKAKGFVGNILRFGAGWGGVRDSLWSRGSRVPFAPGAGLQILVGI